MVEAKIKVEVTEFSNVNNPFYGNTITKKVVETSYLHDMDKRKDFAPCGIVATFSIDKGYRDTEGKKIDAKEVFNVKVTRHCLDADVLPNTYHTFFYLDEKVYELYAHIDGKHIVHMGLMEWLNNCDFEDGAEADNTYDAKNGGLVTCDILE